MTIFSVEFEQTEYTTTEAVGFVELCVLVSPEVEELTISIIFTQGISNLQGNNYCQL